jgi:hypothetical protein
MAPAATIEPRFPVEYLASFRSRPSSAKEKALAKLK